MKENVNCKHQQYLQTRRTGAHWKSDSIWSSAHFGNVRIQPGTYHHDAGAAKVPVTGAELGMLLQNAMFAAGISNYDPVVSFMEDRIKTSGCNGCQFYFRNCT